MIDDLTAAIRDGDHDDNLGKLFDALLARASEIETDFAWKITLDGDEWNRESVTLTELAQAERHTGVSYTQIDPIRHMDHLVALIVAHLHRVKGLKIEAAIKAAGDLTASDLADLITVYEVKKAPKDETVEPATS